jgi:hypothetical protein
MSISFREYNMAQLRKRQVHFADYKAIKDEIIEISEQRFENILTTRLKEFKAEIVSDIDKRFNDVDKKINDLDQKFEQKFKIVFWILGIFITLYIATYSILLNIIIGLKK